MPGMSPDHRDELTAVRPRGSGTPASFVRDPWTFDPLDPANGWTQGATPDTATVITGYLDSRPTALLLDARDARTQRLESHLPRHVTLFGRFEDIDFARFELFIAVTWRLYVAPVPTLHLWARTLCVGVGCTRDADPADLSASAEAMLRAEGLPPESVCMVASAALKRHEPALRSWSAALDAAFVTFDEAALRAVEVPNPSAIADQYAGTRSVAEAAALLAAGRTDLLMPKRKAALAGGHHLTLAVARRMKPIAGPGDLDHCPPEIPAAMPCRATQPEK